MDKPKFELARLGYSPDDFPKMTGGAISRTRVYGALRDGSLKAKKVGPRTIIEPEEARRFINSFPDWQSSAADDAA
jgi:hypothetical protein